MRWKCRFSSLDHLTVSQQEGRNIIILKSNDKLNQPKKKAWSRWLTGVFSVKNIWEAVKRRMLAGYSVTESPRKSHFHQSKDSQSQSQSPWWSHRVYLTYCHPLTGTPILTWPLKSQRCFSPRDSTDLIIGMCWKSHQSSPSSGTKFTRSKSLFLCRWPWAHRLHHLYTSKSWVAAMWLAD